jgi:hypothetical protein
MQPFQAVDNGRWEAIWTYTVRLIAIALSVAQCTVTYAAEVEVDEVGYGEAEIDGEIVIMQYTLPKPSLGSWADRGPLKEIPDSDPAIEKESMVREKGASTDTPSLAATIEGLNFDTSAALDGLFHIPPDPYNATGPSQVMSVMNTAIQWMDKDGTNIVNDSLSGFFTSLTPINSTFDPKCIYDQFSNRFVVVTLERNESGNVTDPANTSRILAAVSQTSDPNDGFFFLSINAKTTIDGLERWADYPGLAVDEEVVYITNSMFGFADGGGAGTLLWVIDKTAFYAGGSAAVTVFDPADLAVTFDNSFRPAHIFGTAPSGVGTWLVGFSGVSNGTEEFLHVIRVDDPLGTPAFSVQFIDLGNLTDLPAFVDAPQSGSAERIETNDNRLLHAVWRNDALYSTTTIMPRTGNDVGEVTAHWFQVDTTNVNSLALTDQGNIGGEDIATGTHTFYPTVAVDQNDNVAFGFAASAATIFPGAYYTVRKAGDAAGAVRDSAVLAEGADFYIRKFGGSRNRWGDYTGIAIDPSDDVTVWLYNEYALARGTELSDPGEDGRWGTRYGRFVMALEAQDDIWVDVDHFGAQVGSETLPFVAVQDGLDALNENGTLHLEAGTYNAAPLTLSTAMIIRADSGTARIEGN